MTNEHRRLLTMLNGDGVDGINEAMLERHGFTSLLFDFVLGIGHARFEPRRYGARGNAGFDLTVRRFYITAAGKAALNNGANK